MMLACEFLVVSGVHRECFHLLPDCPMYSNRFPHPFTRDERRQLPSYFFLPPVLGGGNGKLCCSSLSSVAVINTGTKSNLGEERVDLACRRIIQGSQVKSSREEPGVRNRSRDLGGTLLTGLLLGLCSTTFLIKTRLTSLAMVPSTVGYSLPPLAIKKMPRICAYMPV